MTFSHQFVDLFVQEIPQSILYWMPETLVEAECVLPVELDEDVLVVAVLTPDDFALEDKIRFICNREIRLVSATREAMAYAIRKYYPAAKPSFDRH